LLNTYLLIDVFFIGKFKRLDFDRSCSWFCSVLRSLVVVVDVKVLRVCVCERVEDVA